LTGWLGGSGGGIDSANSAFTPEMGPAGLAGSGYDAGSAGPAELGSVARNQGASVVGSRLGEMDPEQFARQGADKITGGPVNTQSDVPVSHETAAATTPWWQSAGNKIGTGATNEVNQALANPIRTSLGAASLAAPLIGAGIAAANQPRPAKAGPAPAQVPVKPFPGTIGTSEADLPAASPMSPLHTGTGGFKVRGQAGFGQTPGQGMAEGGRVGGPRTPQEEQDERDYQEAMRGMKGQPGPAQAPTGPKKDAYQDQLDQIDKTGKNPKSGYFRVR
jgi:hypothetical protein